MAQVMHSGVPTRTSHPLVGNAAHQAYLVLHIGYIILPIVAGLDKFFDLLGNWDAYLTPQVTDILRVNAHTFMMIVGVIEIVAGLIVAFRPQIGAYVVMLWLLAIIINLLMLSGTTGVHYYDIALRDFGLSLGALALARLGRDFGAKPFSV